MSDFDTFWAAYPRRVAKGHARTAFDRALRKTSLEKMLTAIADYIRFKPERIDFKHPATWLNGECWDDEWQHVPAPKRDFNTILDAMQGKPNAPHHTGPTIEASFERRDRSGIADVVQLHAISARG